MKIFSINFIKRLQKRVWLSKRQGFLLVTFLLTGMMISSHLVLEELHIQTLIFLAVVTYVLSAFALRENLKGWEFVTLLILPTFYTAAVFLFYFLLPGRWLTRLPIAALYGIGVYSILLTENIYNVAAERTIQLLRAGHTLGLLLTLLTFFLLTDTFLSLRLPFYSNVILSLLVTFPLTFQSLWSMELTENISKNIWLGTGIMTWVIAQFVFLLSFWPLNSTLQSLFLTTIFYSLIGMMQQYLVGRLFPKTTREYVTWIFLAFVALLAVTRWGSGV